MTTLREQDQYLLTEGGDWVDRNKIDENKRLDVVEYLIRGMRKIFSTSYMNNREQQSGGKMKYVRHNIEEDSIETGQIEYPNTIEMLQHSIELYSVPDIKKECKEIVIFKKESY